jgi:hypothetical protein
MEGNSYYNEGMEKRKYKKENTKERNKEQSIVCYNCNCPGHKSFDCSE